LFKFLKKLLIKYLNNSTVYDTNMKIGITYFAQKNIEMVNSIWSNGANQNIFFLYHLFKQSPLVEEVYIVNGGDGKAIPPGIQQDQNVPLTEFVDVADQLDVFIEAGAQISPDQAIRVQAHGGVVIGYRCGNDYVMDVERICFGRPSGAIFNGTPFDVIWTHAQHMNTCKDFWEIGLRAPVVLVPHVWAPYFVDRAAREVKQLPGDLVFGYEENLRRQQAAKAAANVNPLIPDKTPLQKRTGNFEPNVNVVKCSLTPLLVCEAAMRARPELWKTMFFGNTEHLKEHVTFKSIALQLDIVQKQKASFEARFPLPVFLAQYVDIVLAHQWENALNYLYYDALYGHYPLVHNSHFLKDIGYYYEGFDAQAGGRALIRAATEHDQNLEAYGKQCDAFLHSRSIYNQTNIDDHVSKLVTMLADKKRTMAAAQ
jgi:Protein of unknown function (DUF2827)